MLTFEEQLEEEHRTVEVAVDSHLLGVVRRRSVLGVLDCIHRPDLARKIDCSPGHRQVVAGIVVVRAGRMDFVGNRPCEMGL